MDILNELVNVITKNKVKQIDVIGNRSDKKSRVNEFYQSLVSQKFKTAKEAAACLLQTEETDPAFIKLRNKLEKRLLNTVFFIDIKQPSYNEQQKAYYTCLKEWAATKILFGKGARKSALQLSKKILKQALRFEFTELAIDAARMLRLHYGAMSGDEKKFNYYNQLFRELESVWIAENRAEELYTTLTLRYVFNKSTKEDIHQLALACSAELEPLLDRYSSNRLHLSGRLIQVIGYTSINDFPGTIQVCQRAIDFFENKKYLPKTAVQIFLHQQLVCYTQLRQYETGREVAEKCLEYLSEGNFNWFKHEELYLTLSLHTGQYQKAYEIFSKVAAHPNLEAQAQQLRETWKIIEAYIHYLALIGQVVPAEGDQRFHHFRVARFLNEVPAFSKDKAGMNVPILIIQILFSILQKKYNTAIDRIETIEKYCSRYLRKDDSFRSNCFIKMLLQIPISGFHRHAVQRKAAPLLQRLRDVPLEIANQPHGIEIIPYETLWEFALLSLDTKHARLPDPVKQKR